MTMEELWDAVNFICSMEFLIMAVLWTMSLLTSYLQLFVPRLIGQKTNAYAHPRCLPQMRGSIRPVCIVTGATSGLGAATAQALSNEGFCVVLAGRSMHSLSKTMAQIKRHNKDAHLKAFQIDLSSFPSILKFVGSLERWLMDSNMHSSIQLLVNNAGIFATSYRRTTEGYDQMMATNYIGAFSLTKLLLPLLSNSPVPSRIVNVTSFTHRSVFGMQIDKETVSGKGFLGLRRYPCAHIYEYSKLFLLLFSYKLHQQLRLMDNSCQFSIIAADPGAVKTQIMREVPPCLSRASFVMLKLLGLLQSAENGARSIIDASLAPPEISGLYFFGGEGRTLNSSALSYSATLAEELWNISSDLFLESKLASMGTSTPDQG